MDDPIMMGDFTLWSLLAIYLPVLVVAWLVGIIATPLIRWVAIEFDIVDHPDEARKQHARPIAYLGGLAVFLAVLAGIAVSEMLVAPISFRSIPMTVVIGMIAITITGLGDDIWGWEPVWKISGQLVAAAGLSLFGIGTQTAGAFLGYFFGTREIVFDAPLLLVACVVALPLLVWWLGIKGLGRALVAMWWICLLALIVVIGSMWIEPLSGFKDLIWMPLHIDVTELVGVGLVAILVLGGCNATNLIDGLDGLLAGTGVLIGCGLLVISILMALHLTEGDLRQLTQQIPNTVVERDGVTLAGARIALCLAMIGALLGFLAYNFNPAIIFLGDTGSLLIGYLCVTIILTLGELGQTHFVLAGLIVFGLPIVDTVLAIFRRKVQGLPASAPDANHLHHILKRHLGSVRQAVLGMWAIESLLAIIGVAIVAMSITGEVRVMAIYLVAAFIFGGVAVAGTIMGRRQMQKNKS